MWVGVGGWCGDRMKILCGGFYFHASRRVVRVKGTNIGTVVRSGWAGGSLVAVGHGPS